MGDDPEWFAPKQFGYGAGLPIAWQGWALLIGYIALIALISLLIPYSVLGYLSVMTMITVPFLVVVARTTRGGWRWRSGGEY
jgi:hypothetical protein